MFEVSFFSIQFLPISQLALWSSCPPAEGPTSSPSRPPLPAQPTHTPGWPPGWPPGQTPGQTREPTPEPTPETPVPHPHPHPYSFARDTPPRPWAAEPLAPTSRPPPSPSPSEPTSPQPPPSRRSRSWSSDAFSDLRGNHPTTLLNWRRSDPLCSNVANTRTLNRRFQCSSFSSSPNLLKISEMQDHVSI